MSDSRIAQRYARALMTTAEAAKRNPTEFLAALETIEELYKIPESRRFLVSPVMPLDVKLELLSFAIAKVNGGTELKKFSEIIVAAGRVAIFPQIIDSYRKMIRDIQGTEEGVVTAFSPLSADDMVKLAAELTQTLDRKVTLSQKTDQSLLGGFVVKIGHFLLDHSLKTRIEALAFDANH